MIILKKKAIYATFLVLLFIVGVTAQTVSASPANIDSQMVVFNCGAMGKGFVIWDGYPADPPMPDAYFENTFKGFVSFMGSALVEGPTDGWYVAEKPKSIQSRGVLVVDWRHKGIKYELNIDYHSTKRTSGLFNPQIDSFVVPNPDTPGLPIPGISPKL